MTILPSFTTSPHCVSSCRRLRIVIVGARHVHALYKPLPGKFKDYIAFPKPNGYQSLHTTVVTPEAGIVEIQIRTEEMHRRAQFGIASHMSYKQLGKGMEKFNKEMQRSKFSSLSFTWVSPAHSLAHEIFEKENEGGAESAVKAPYGSRSSPKHIWISQVPKSSSRDLREDFFSHRVFVFTPKGDVIDLPIASTPIDFAYAIHSDLRDHLQGAKVNGKLVLETPLGNGEVVEIIRRDFCTLLAEMARCRCETRLRVDTSAPR